MISREKKPALWVLAIVTAFVVVLGGCYPADELTVSDLDVVATFFKPGTNFATKLTYALPAMIFDLSDETIQNDPAAQNIIADINQHMQDYGFTVADTSTADVLLLVFKNQTTWVGGSCYPAYYPYYWGWCYPVAYSYETGSLIIVMLDRATIGTQAPAIWVAGLNGVLEGSTSASLSARVENGIHQAFQQSPYLGEGK